MDAEQGTAVIANLDQFVAPPGLDGSQGIRRMDSACKTIVGSIDSHAIYEWLSRLTDKSPSGRAADRKAAERVLNWACFVRGKALSSLDDADVHAFRLFLSDPSPARDWICPIGSRRGTPAWRPFNGPLADRQVEIVMRSVQGLFVWMERVGYARMPKVHYCLADSSSQSVSLPMKVPVNPISESAWTWLVKASMTGPLSSRLMLDLLYFGNLKPCEIRRLMASDCLEPTQARPYWRLSIRWPNGKRRVERVMKPLGDTLAAWLAHWGIPEGHLASLVAAHGEDVPLIPERITNAGVRGSLHQAATMAEAAGDIQAAHELLGSTERNFRDAVELHVRAKARPNLLPSDPKRKVVRGLAQMVMADFNYPQEIQLSLSFEGQLFAAEPPSP